MYKLRIRDYRRLRKISQRDLASRIGISQSFLSEIENGKYDVKLSLLFKLGDALHVCPHALLNYSCNSNCALYCDIKYM